MDRISEFKKELNAIKRSDIRCFCELALNSLPDYFFWAAASSTGKYHPNYAQGPGGLVRHEKAAVGIAIELFKCESIFRFSEIEKDIIIAALLLHDGCKSGKTYSHTKPDHPLLVVSLLKELNHCLHQELFESICDCIVSHMGHWNKDFETEILPLPQTKTQKFVHICDFLASRKCLEFNFDV